MNKQEQENRIRKKKYKSQKVFEIFSKRLKKSQNKSLKVEKKHTNKKFSTVL